MTTATGAMQNQNLQTIPYVNAVCSLNAEKPFSSEGIGNRHYKPKNELKCYSTFELHFSVKVYEIYSTYSSTKNRKLHNYRHETCLKATSDMNYALETGSA